MGRVSEGLWVITPQAYLLGAVALLTVPFPWVSAWIIAAVSHECFHCMALRLAGKQIRSIRVGVFGASIRTEPLGPALSAVCALAGPLCSLCFLFLAHVFPRLALSALLQSVYNILPVYPLDGSVILRGLADLLFSEKTAERLCAAVEMTVLFIALLGCIVLAIFRNLGFLPVMFVGLLVRRIGKGKSSCKYGLYRVQ